jgi:hypothetical protein
MGRGGDVDFRRVGRWLMTAPGAGTYSCAISLSIDVFETDACRWRCEENCRSLEARWWNFGDEGASTFLAVRASRPFWTSSMASAISLAGVVEATKCLRLLRPRLLDTDASLDADDADELDDVRRYDSCGVIRGEELGSTGGVVSRPYSVCLICTETGGGVCEGGGVSCPFKFSDATWCCNCISPRSPLTSSVPLDGIALNTDTGLSGFGGVSDSDGSRESELSRDARFGGPNLVNRPRRRYLVDPDGAGCLRYYIPPEGCTMKITLSLVFHGYSPPLFQGHLRFCEMTMNSRRVALKSSSLQSRLSSLVSSICCLYSLFQRMSDCVYSALQ